MGLADAMPLRAEGAARTFRQNVVLAASLAGVAGMVNAAGFLVLGLHTSHMTGHAAAVGESLVSGRYDLVRLAGTLLLVFLLGAIAAGVAIESAAGWRRFRYTPALALEGLVLVTSATIASRKAGLSSVAVAGGLCFAMGLQNALVTRISGAVIRTTHLTGVLTDLGLELVRVARWLWSRSHGSHGLVELGRSRELERASLHLTLFASFLVGATIGPLLVLHFGNGAIAAPCLVLLGLIVLDRRPRT